MGYSQRTKVHHKETKKFYEMIDRVYQLERVIKTRCYFIRRGKFVATVHRQGSGYENTHTTDGSPISTYVEEGNRANLR
jgi:hypothetical protein